MTINGQTFRFEGTAQNVYQKADHAAQGGDAPTPEGPPARLLTLTGIAALPRGGAVAP